MIMKQPHIQNDFKFLDLSDTLTIKSDRDTTSSHISKARAQIHTSFTQCQFFTPSNSTTNKKNKTKQEKGIND